MIQFDKKYFFLIFLTLFALLISKPTQGAGGLPIISADASTISGTAPLTIQFTGFATDTDGFIVSYYWDFGDGSTSSEKSPTHTYISAGYYIVIFCAVDNENNPVCLLGDITVSSPSVPIPTPTPPSSGDGGGGGGGTLVPPPPVDVTPPKISEVQIIDLASTSAKITWKTDEPTTFKFNYGTTSSYEMGEISNASSSLVHSVFLTNLSASTTYFFRLKNIDSNNNVSQSVQYSFVTLAAEETPSLKPQLPAVTPGATSTAEVSASAKARLIKILKARIAQILALITQLRAQLQELLAREGVEAIPSSFRFEKTLQYGDRNTEVRYLQIFLKSQGKEIYPEGLVTGYFGLLTRTAVIRFQEQYSDEILTPYGLEQGTGLVGKTTRAKINQFLGK